MNTELTTVENLTSYLAQIGNIPLLTEEEELELARKFYHDNDLEAARKMILSHLKFVVFIAKRYKNYNLPLEDLIQEGNIGLMKAVNRFNPERGVKLSSFAVHYIKSEILEYIVRNFKPAKIATTKAQRKLFFNLRSLKSDIGYSTQKERESIAKSLNVSVNDVEEMEERIYTSSLSFDTPEDDNDNTKFIPSEHLAAEYGDPLASLEEEYQTTIKDKIMDYINALPERNADIILSRKFMDPVVPLRELSERYNISMERVRQIEAKIINKLSEIVSEFRND